MPFKSEAQRKWMHAEHPEMAKRWEAETTETALPARVGSGRKRAASSGPDPALVKALKASENRGVA